MQSPQVRLIIFPLLKYTKTMSNLSSQFDNVLNLDASRKVKEKTGRGVPIKMTAPESPELIKHEDEAMALGNPVPKKKSTFDKAMEYLGL